MHYHSLVFSAVETAELQAICKPLDRLVQSLKPIPLSLAAEWRQTLTRILVHQEGLGDFWRQLEDQTLGHYHLHLVHEDKALLNLPWQQLAIDEEKYPFTRISKGTFIPNQLVEYKPLPGPLKILVLIASPGDLTISRRLSYEEEEEAILNALSALWQSNQVQVDFTEDGSLESLRQQLAANHYHILYFSGHGTYENNTGYLLMENEYNLKSEYIPAQKFAQTLMEYPEHMPALVILSTCHSARGQAKSGFRGVTDVLLHIGVPAVIAMASSIMDHYATIFSAAFYQCLARKEPLLRAFYKALGAIRQQERQGLGQNVQAVEAKQWLIPQLYLSQSVEYLVDWASPNQLLAPNVGLAADAAHFSFFPHHENYQFIGRRRESAQSFRHLVLNEPVLLRGQGGVGKTALAEHLVRRVITHDPSSVCFAFDEMSFGIEAMVEVLQNWLRDNCQLFAIGQEVCKREKATDQMDFLLESVTQKCKPLWVFDNMDSCQDSSGGSLKKEYLEWIEYIKKRMLNRFSVIFTGRYSIQELPRLFECNLNQVGYVDYYRKCRQLNIVAIADLQDAGLTGFGNICRLLYHNLGGSYRALELFDEIYKTDPSHARDLLLQLQTQSFDGQGKKATPALASSVRERLVNDTKKLVFDELLRALGPQEARIISLLAQFRIPVLPMAIEMQTELKDVESLLRRLVDVTLIEEKMEPSGLQYYYVTPLVRDWLEHKHKDQVIFSDEVAAHYYEYVGLHVRAGNSEDAKEAFRHYVKCRNIGKVNSIGAALSEYYYEAALFHLSLKYASETESVAESETAPIVLAWLGLLFLAFSNYDKSLSYSARSLEIFRSQGAKASEAFVLGNIGEVFRARGEYRKALAYDEECLSIYRILDDNHAVGASLNNLSVIYSALGEADKALDSGEKALLIARSEGDRKTEASFLNNLGFIEENRGQFEEAARLYSEALAIHKTENNVLGMATSLNNIAMIYKMMRKFDEAFDYCERSLTIWRTVGDRANEALMLNNIAQVYSENGEYDKAMPFYNQSLEISQAIGDDVQKGRVLHNIATTAMKKGDHIQFENREREALEIFSRCEYAEGIFLSGSGLGLYYLIQKGSTHRKKALSILNRCYKIGIRMNSPYADKLKQLINQHSGKGKNKLRDTSSG